VHRYVHEVRDLARARRDATEEASRKIDEGIPDALMDPREPSPPPKKEAPVPYFDFSPLDNASDELTRAARDFDRAAEASAAGLTPARAADVNALVRTVERAMTRAEGLPRRPWFRHYVYAPGFYTGYGVKTLPAVREAIEEKQWGDVNREIAKTAEAIAGGAARIREAAKKLGAP